MKPTLNNDALPISDAINGILIKYCSALAEITKLNNDNARLGKEIGMKANPDILKDFSALQQTCNELGKSNVELAQKNARLREEIARLQVDVLLSYVAPTISPQSDRTQLRGGSVHL